MSNTSKGSHMIYIVCFQSYGSGIFTPHLAYHDKIEANKEYNRVSNRIEILHSRREALLGIYQRGCSNELERIQMITDYHSNSKVLDLEYVEVLGIEYVFIKEVELVE